MKQKLLTFFAALLCAASMGATTTVTWNSSVINDFYLDCNTTEYSNQGITLYLNASPWDYDAKWMPGNIGGVLGDHSFTFRTSVGTITRIEITMTGSISGSGWSATSPGAVWTGNASRVDLGLSSSNLTQIVFTIDESGTEVEKEAVANPFIFNYCYDCNRVPAYPNANRDFYTAWLSNPHVGNGSSAGPWKLEYVGQYDPYSDTYGINDFIEDNIAPRYSIADPRAIEIFALYQMQAGTWVLASHSEGNTGYGVVVGINNKVGENCAVFLSAPNENGCFLTNLSQVEVSEYDANDHRLAVRIYYDIQTGTQYLRDNIFSLTAHQDPQHPSDYYSTFYHGSNKYELPAGTEAYTATISGDALNLKKIAQGGQTIPSHNAVIIKTNSSSITLIVSDASPVSVGTNHLQGTDIPLPNPDNGNTYVLSAVDGEVGFYVLADDVTIPVHKAYINLSDMLSAPRRLRFVFDATTGVGEITNDQSPMTNKVLRDGRLIIIRNGVEYNANGQIVK